MSDPLSTLPLPFKSAVVIDDPHPHSAALNMAIDEVLLGGLGESPLLRCYRWTNRAVSFGCFGKFAAVKQTYPGRELVRRWTGGGEVEHGEDFTYTLLVPRPSPLTSIPARDSYRLIHGTVAAALAGLGTHEIELSGESQTGRVPEGTATFLKPCFVNPVPFDLLAANRKVAGGAQRRTKCGMLHQGSIQGFIFDQALDEHWRARICGAMASSFADSHTSRQLSEEEIAGAETLAREKYSAVSWMEKY